MTHKEIINREEAIMQGKRHYYTGKYCKNGHTEERLTTTGSCVACLKKYRVAAGKRIVEEMWRASGGTTKMQIVVHPEDVKLVERFCSCLIQSRINPHLPNKGHMLIDYLNILEISEVKDNERD